MYIYVIHMYCIQYMCTYVCAYVYTYVHDSDVLYVVCANVHGYCIYTYIG